METRKIVRANGALEAQIERMKCCGNCANNGHICAAEEIEGAK